MKNRLHDELGEQIEERLHPDQQRRSHSSSNTSWWDKSGWNWKWAHKFSDFSYSWFRVQSIAIHCNRRVVWTDAPHWQKSLMHMSSHVWACIVSFFVFFFFLSCFYFLSHCLLVLCLAHQLRCGRNRRGKTHCTHAQWGVLLRGDTQPSHKNNTYVLTKWPDDAFPLFLTAACVSFFPRSFIHNACMTISTRHATKNNVEELGMVVTEKHLGQQLQGECQKRNWGIQDGGKLGGRCQGGRWRQRQDQKNLEATPSRKKMKKKKLVQSWKKCRKSWMRPTPEARKPIKDCVGSSRCTCTHGTEDLEDHRTSVTYFGKWCKATIQSRRTSMKMLMKSLRKRIKKVELIVRKPPFSGPRNWWRQSVIESKKI